MPSFSCQAWPHVAAQIAEIQNRHKTKSDPIELRSDELSQIN